MPTAAASARVAALLTQGERLDIHGVLLGAWPDGDTIDRLAAVGFTWGLSALNQSPDARAHYDRRRTAGDGHAAAFRHLFNRFLGCLHHCLRTRQDYREGTAFPISVEATIAA